MDIIKVVDTKINIVLQVVFFGLIPLGILSTTISSAMKMREYDLDAFKLLITLIGVGLVYGIAYFLIGYTMRQGDEGFFQCNIAYGNWHWRQWMPGLPNHPYNGTFHATDVLEVSHNPVSDPHWWITLSE